MIKMKKFFLLMALSCLVLQGIKAHKTVSNDEVILHA